MHELHYYHYFLNVIEKLQKFIIKINLKRKNTYKYDIIYLKFKNNKNHLFLFFIMSKRMPIQMESHCNKPWNFGNYLMIKLKRPKQYNMEAFDKTFVFKGV